MKITKCISLLVSRRYICIFGTKSECEEVDFFLHRMTNNQTDRLTEEQINTVSFSFIYVYFNEKNKAYLEIS